MKGDKGSMICKGYAVANNKFLKSNDVNKPTPYLIYLDTNSLNEHSMMQPLATEILDCVNQKDFNLDVYSNDSLIAYSFEVDFDSPVELYDFPKDYSLACKKIKVAEKMLNISYKTQKIIIFLLTKANNLSII